MTKMGYYSQVTRILKGCILYRLDIKWKEYEINQGMLLDTLYLSQWQ